MCLQGLSVDQLTKEQIADKIADFRHPLSLSPEFAIRR